MKNNFYPIIIEEHKEGGYYARCPVIQGAWADGETIERAVENLKSILKDILEYRKLIAKPAIKYKEQELWQGLAIAV